MRAVLLILLVAVPARAAELPAMPEEIHWISLPSTVHEACYLTPDLKVHGRERALCIELLETAARFARAEDRVNVAMKHRRK